MKSYENATQASNLRARKAMPMLDEEDEYSLIESQLEKQRRLKLKEDRASTETLI